MTEMVSQYTEKNNMLNNNIKEIISHIDTSIANAINNKSKLNDDILNLTGFSGRKTRHLYNNLCDIENINYLEIGTYLGSTLISSAYGNKLSAIGVDNWSEFDGPKEKCIDNIKKYIDEYKLIEKNFFELNTSDIAANSIDIYLYDGSHTYDSQFAAITHCEKFLKEISLILIDDFRDDGNWAGVIKGTYDGLQHSTLNIEYQHIIRSKQEENGHNDFWNGCGIFLCSKDI